MTIRASRSSGAPCSSHPHHVPQTHTSTVTIRTSRSSGQPCSSHSHQQYDCILEPLGPVDHCIAHTRTIFLTPTPRSSHLHRAPHCRTSTMSIRTSRSSGPSPPSHPHHFPHTRTTFLTHAPSSSPPRQHYNYKNLSVQWSTASLTPAPPSSHTHHLPHTRTTFLTPAHALCL